MQALRSEFVRHRCGDRPLNSGVKGELFTFQEVRYAKKINH